MSKLTTRLIGPLLGLVVLAGAAPALANEARWRLNGAPLTESSGVTWTGKIKVVNSEYWLGMGVECEEHAEGSAGAKGAGEITKWTMSSCVSVRNCGKNGISVEALHLPWHSELANVGGSIRELLVSGGSGTPGFKIKCKIGGLEVSPEVCVGKLATETTNATGGVSAAFLAAEKLSCTINEGTNETGTATVEGTQSITTSSGKLSAEIEEAPEWRANGAAISSPSADEWGGKIKLTDTGFGVYGVECNVTGKGFAGAGAAGEVTNWTTSSCLPSSGSNCAFTGVSLEAIDLPWHTELLEEGFQSITETGGHGKPGFVLKCTVSGEPITDECHTIPPTIMTNSEAGVVEAFNNKEKFTCSKGRANAASLEGSQTVKLTSGAKLTVRY